MKRKRNKEPQTKRREKKAENPFLELQNASFPGEAKQVQENNVLSKVLAFSEVSRQRLDYNNDKFQKAVEDLLGYLETLDCTSTGSLVSPVVSPVDVAYTILQWAVKGLLYTCSHQHSGTQTSEIAILLYWKALRSSLQTLLSLKDDSGCLSQSALNKLVLYGAQVALDENAGNDATVCYTLLVDQFYRPTMDSACHSLLPLVDKRLSQSASTDGGCLVLSSKDHVRILESTLRLLQTLQGNSNPKKTFQLLADPKVFSMLSRWRLAKEGSEVGSNSISGIVRELLWEGLFSPLYHVEGFRSMNLVVPGIETSTDTAKSGDASKPDGGKQNKPFHCYQQSLLETVATLITDVAESTTDTVHIIAGILVVPELMNGFIEQSAIWERDYGGKAGKKGATFMAAVQFRLWSNLIWPMVVGLRKFVMIPSKEQGRLQMEFDPTLVMMRSLRETLSLVLQHNIYLPSYQDKDNANFLFLETITTTFLDILGTIRNVGTLSRCSIEIECLQGLETLICLNHLVAHDRLSSIISACGLINEGSDPEECVDMQTHRKTLVASLVKTYQRLRQLDHLFRSLLEAADALRKSTACGSREGVIQASAKQRKQALSSLRGLILEKEVCAEFAAAVQKCPPGQIQELFGDLNKWIRIRSDEVHSGATPSVGDTGSDDMSLVVALFVLLIRNVRVDKHTAVGVATLCDEAIETAVRPLIVAHEFKREALVLSGWLVDLRTRYAFWLDECKESSKKDSFDIFAVVLKDLGLANSSGDVNMMADDIGHDEGLAKLNDSTYGPMLNEIQFLLCHRIRELHSTIYEDQRAGLTRQQGSQRSSALVREARRLVNFVVALAECPPAQSSESSAVAVSGSRWKILAETVSYWVPYSESKHVDSFLLWMFSTLSVTEDLSDNVNGSIRANPRDNAVVSCVVVEEKRVAEALLRDSSFFEIPELITQFDATGLKCAVKLLSIALSTRNGGKEHRNPIKIHGLELASLFQNSNPLPSSLKQFGDAMSALSSKTAKLALKGRTIRLDLLSRALQIMQLLNGSPRASTSLLSVDMSLGLDILTSAMCFESTASEIERVVLPLLCAIRTYTASSAIDHLHEYIDDTLLFFLHGYIQSTTAVMKLIRSSNEEAHQSKLLRASGMLVRAITTSCLSHFKHSPERVKSLFNCFKKLILGDRVVRDETENRVLMNMTRSFVRRVVAFADCNGLLDNGDFKSTVVEPFITAMQEAVCKADMADKPMLNNQNLRAEWFLLMGDTTRLTALMAPSTPTEMVDSSIIKRSLVCDEDDATSRAANYYLACIVASGSVLPSVTKLVIDQCLSGNAGCNQLNEAALCGIVRGMKFDEMYRLLKRVLNKARTSDSCRLSALRVFQLLLENVQQDDQARIEVSRVSRSFFVMSLELLHPLDRPDVSSWASEVDLGTSLLITLTQQKDIIAIRERDLALLLAQVESALGEGGSFRNPNVLPADGRVYSSCYMLVSSLLQRFPKQLHACVPSVVSTMHTLLRHALYGELSDPEIMQRAQMFTRLCELLIPHREVYKKHVLGLILEFVGALSTNVYPSRSKGIVPAIYFLLDMLSQYETEQLNTMMDATAKTQFRSVYQSHQKTHRYKGQY